MDDSQLDPERAVIVGLDGREHDADALVLARTLQTGLDGWLVLVHVIAPPPLGRGMTEYAWEARSEGRELLAHAAEEAGSGSQTRLLETWPAAHALAELAWDRQASMLVLGSSHRGAVGRIVPGGVASHLLSRAPCPIAVAPVGYGKREDGPVARVGVAYDATRKSDIALQAAAHVAMHLGVPLQIYHAIHAIPSEPAWDEFRGHMEEFAQATLDRGLEQLPPELEAASRVLEGDVATAVAQAASEDGVGLLYVGSRGYGPLREALFGGAAGALLQTARCPLVIIPRRCAAIVDESPHDEKAAAAVPAPDPEASHTTAIAD